MKNYLSRHVALKKSTTTRATDLARAGGPCWCNCIFAAQAIH